MYNHFNHNRLPKPTRPKFLLLSLRDVFLVYNISRCGHEISIHRNGRRTDQEARFGAVSWFSV